MTRMHALPGSLSDLFAETRRIADIRKRLADDLASSGKPVRLTANGGRSALAGPDMSKPGMFRLTRFDALGPSGHTEHPTLQEAILEALRQHYVPLGEESTRA